MNIEYRYLICNGFLTVERLQQHSFSCAAVLVLLMYVVIPFFHCLGCRFEISEIRCLAEKFRLDGCRHPSPVDCNRAKTSIAA